MKFSNLKGPLLLILTMLSMDCFSQDYASTQNKIKSLYIYSFIKYVEWPAEIQQSDFKVCILRDNEFSKSLENLLLSKHKGDRKIVVELIEPSQGCKSCDLLFISEEEDVIKIKSRDFTNPGLWVTSGFFNQSISDIALLYSDTKLQYAVNKELLPKTKFRVPAQMMVLANQKLIAQ